MSNNPWPDMRIDLGLHARNRDAVPVEYLIPFCGKNVAWHADGTHIVASSESDTELLAELARLGIDSQDVVFDYIDAPLEVAPPVLSILPYCRKNNPFPDLRFDLALYMRNYTQVPDEYLVPFRRKNVAWHGDGTHIVAAAETNAELDSELSRLGIDTQDVVFGYVDHPDDVYF